MGDVWYWNWSGSDWLYFSLLLFKKYSGDGIESYTKFASISSLPPFEFDSFEKFAILQKLIEEKYYLCRIFPILYILDY